MYCPYDGYIEIIRERRPLDSKINNNTDFGGKKKKKTKIIFLLLFYNSPPLSSPIKPFAAVVT